MAPDNEDSIYAADDRCMGLTAAAIGILAIANALIIIIALVMKG